MPVRARRAMGRRGPGRDADAMSVIEVSELRKSYGGRAVVDGVSFAVEEGEIFGILGPNGAGKTTTVECVEGLRIPEAGRVRVTGLDPVADHARVARVLGAQLQESGTPGRADGTRGGPSLPPLCQVGRERPRRGGRD